MHILTNTGESFLRKIEGVVAGSDTGQSPLLLGIFCTYAFLAGLYGNV
jgi:hypothetical protein